MRRSFFLFVITVRNSPCNFKRNVDRSAEKREQKHDLFKRHGASPLPALKHSGENEIFKKKSSLAGTQVPVRSSCNGADRRLWRKQGGEVGAAASKTRVPLKTRSGCWVPQPVLRLWAQRLMAALPPQIQHIINLHEKQYFAALSCQTGKRTVFSTHTMPLRIPYSR